MPRCRGGRQARCTSSVITAGDCFRAGPSRLGCARIPPRLGSSGSSAAAGRQLGQGSARRRRDRSIIGWPMNRQSRGRPKQAGSRSRTLAVLCLPRARRWVEDRGDADHFRCVAGYSLSTSRDWPIGSGVADARPRTGGARRSTHDEDGRTPQDPASRGRQAPVGYPARTNRKHAGRELQHCKPIIFQNCKNILPMTLACC